MAQSLAVWDSTHISTDPNSELFLPSVNESSFPKRLSVSTIERSAKPRRNIELQAFSPRRMNDKARAQATDLQQQRYMAMLQQKNSLQ